MTRWVQAGVQFESSCPPSATASSRTRALAGPGMPEQHTTTGSHTSLCRARDCHVTTHRNHAL